MLELKLIRKYFTEKSTISDLMIDDQFFCFILEDKDRDLDASMSLDEIKSKKVDTLTAIPTGRYQVIINMSNRFKKDMPLLLNVKGYEGIRIHSGNIAENTEGCLITGMTMKPDRVENSRIAYDKLFELLKFTLSKKEQVFIDIYRKQQTLVSNVVKEEITTHDKNL